MSVNSNICLLRVKQFFFSRQKIDSRMNFSFSKDVLFILFRDWIIRKLRGVISCWFNLGKSQKTPRLRSQTANLCNAIPFRNFSRAETRDAPEKALWGVADYIILVFSTKIQLWAEAPRIRCGGKLPSNEYLILCKSHLLWKSLFFSAQFPDKTKLASHNSLPARRNDDPTSKEKILFDWNGRVFFFWHCPKPWSRTLRWTTRKANEKRRDTKLNWNEEFGRERENIGNGWSEKISKGKLSIRVKSVLECDPIP